MRHAQAPGSSPARLARCRAICHNVPFTRYRASATALRTHSTMHTELNRASIATLVNDFYTDIRRDGVLQPVFDGAIGSHWEPHLERMVDFWCSVMLASGEFKGNVFGKHMQLQGIEPEHFRRWLGLFEAHVRRLFAPAVAEDFLAAARRIAASLQYGYFGRADVV